jgi:hypothetical protein
MKYEIGELVRINIVSDNHDKLAIIIEHNKRRYLPYKCIVQGVPEETFFYAEQHMEKV